MGRIDRRRVGALVAGAVLTALPCFAAHAEVLVYKGVNKWVAPEDNKPLQALLKAARDGTVHYSVQLPTVDRDLAVARLEVLRDILAREAKAAVLMVEVAGTAKPNTLVVE